VSEKCGDANMKPTNKRDKGILSSRKLELYEKNSGVIAYWRKNPVIACEDLL
jgi:hypothetical protein